MQAGNLRHRVTIETPTDATSSVSGAVTQTWATLMTVWAEVKPVSATRRDQASQTIGEVTHEISMRWQPSLPKEFRIGFDGRVFKLLGAPINVDELSAEVRLSAVEVIDPTATV